MIKRTLYIYIYIFINFGDHLEFWLNFLHFIYVKFYRMRDEVNEKNKKSLLIKF